MLTSLSRPPKRTTCFQGLDHMVLKSLDLTRTKNITIKDTARMKITCEVARNRINLTLKVINVLKVTEGAATAQTKIQTAAWLNRLMKTAHKIKKKHTLRS